MVSGLVTSPLDQLRIFSGEARLIRMASKSAMGFPRSNGLDRYKTSSSPAGARRGGLQGPAAHARPLAAPGICTYLGAASCGSYGGCTPTFVATSSGLVGRERSCCEHLALVGLNQLHVEAQRLQFANENVERFRHPRLDRRFAFDDGLVNLGAAINVIGLRSEQFLHDVGCAVGFQGPDFHFSEALTAELCLAAQRLLGNQRIRPDGTCVDLVIHQVRELEHVDVAHGYRLLEALSGHAVIQGGLTRLGQATLCQQRFDFPLLGTVEHRRAEVHGILHAVGHALQGFVVEVGEFVHKRRVLEHGLEFPAHVFRLRVLLQQLANLLSQCITSPPEVGLKDLAHVHTTRHTQRIQNDLHRRAVFEVRHVLFRQDARDNALVSVAPGHLVAHAQLAFHGDVNLHQLDHARRKFIALLQLLDFLADDLAQNINLARGHLLDFVDLFVDARVLVGELDALEVARRNPLNGVAVENYALGQQALVGALVVQVGENFLAAKQRFQALQTLVGKDSNLVGQVLLQLRNLVSFNGLGTFVLLLALAREDLHVDHRALDTRRTGKRSVVHVAGFFTEDGAQQLLFRRELG